MGNESEKPTTEQADEAMADLDAEDDAEKVTGGYTGDPDEGGQLR